MNVGPAGSMREALQGLPAGGWASPLPGLYLCLEFHLLFHVWLLSPPTSFLLENLPSTFVFWKAPHLSQEGPGPYLHSGSGDFGWDWTAGPSQVPCPPPHTPAWPGFLSSEAALPGLGGIRQQFPPNSQADCRHLCCQQNCRKCNSCC